MKKSCDIYLYKFVHVLHIAGNIGQRVEDLC